MVFENNLIHNLNEYKRHYPGFSFAPVLKSNAYGHGLVQVAQILKNQDFPFFVVDSLYEAIFLRAKGIRSPLLVIGYTSSENIQNNHVPGVTFVITSLEQLQEIGQKITAEKKFHLKIDTGMHRQGILPKQIETIIKIIRSNDLICLEGICSHFADADGNSEEFTNFQITQWNQTVEKFKKNFEAIKFFHISATAGANYSDRLKGNVIRLGIGLYGINTSPFSRLNLKPALEMRSVISSVKNLGKGDFVGYNITYKVPGESRIATVPVGYFEGVNRRLSNRGFFKIGNFPCPIVGRVSMNITSVDVSLAPGAKLGDSVVVVSSNKDDKNSIENIARLAETIPYEIMVHIPQHLRRRVVKS